MAIWQYDFHIIPLIKSEKLRNTGIDDVIDTITWNGCEISDVSLDKISNCLIPHKSWIEDIKQYGSIDQTCVQLFYQNNDLESIQIRLDLRDLTKELLELILSFISENNALIVTDTEILSPDYNSFIQRLKASRSFSFVKDPVRLLNSIISSNDS